MTNILTPIWDQYDNVIIDPDLEKGYLQFEKVKIEEIPQKSHYEVRRFYFEDGTSYTPTGLDDPHVNIISQNPPRFNYIDVEEKGKTIRGQEIIPVIDQHAETIYQDIYRYIEYTEEEYRIHQAPKRVDVVEQDITFINDNLDSINTDVSDLIEVTADLSGSDLDSQIEDVKLNVDDLNEVVADLVNSDIEDRVEDNTTTIEDILLFIADLAGGATEETPEEEIPSEETTPEEEITPEEEPSDSPTEEEIPAE
jgi:hypothetical protein